jgi:serine/threonine protein phosphatase PrpC
MPISASLGYASVPAGNVNQDFVGMVTPVAEDLATKGLVAAVADGVSSSAGAREAAEFSVRGLLADYYATPDTWDIGHALDVVLKAINRWLLAQSTSRRELAGMATTLTALVLRGRHYHVAHVGDSRAYLYRGGALRRLTEDHVWDQPDMQHVLRRAMGLDSRLSIDHASDELATGDVFLLATDGVWSTLRDETLAKSLDEVARNGLSAEQAAERLVEAAPAARARQTTRAQSWCASSKCRRAGYRMCSPMRIGYRCRRVCAPARKSMV